MVAQSAKNRPFLSHWKLMDPQPAACKSPTYSLTTNKGSNQAYGKVLTNFAQEVWACGWGSKNKRQYILVSCFTCTPHVWSILPNSLHITLLSNNDELEFNPNFVTLKARNRLEKAWADDVVDTSCIWTNWFWVWSLDKWIVPNKVVVPVWNANVIYAINLSIIQK